ncbi:2-iminobutanoate/2-iminopropanoate deaminase [Hyphomicrobiales bacterium]|nr:2-iminobutanoate/2-iminopropanoate deaminase [Hyphomicrobiales bacterium]
MYEKFATGLAEAKGPVSTAVKSKGLVFMAQIPKDQNGDIVRGDIRVQTRQMLRNLETTVKSAGGTLRDVAQIALFIVNRDDFDAMNEIYAEFFEAPYPARSTVVVKELIAPGMLIEMTAIVSLGPA